MNSNDLDKILDQTTASIRNERVNDAEVKAAADRVWARLAAEAEETAAGVIPATLAAERIESCADFQSLIPAYLRSHLSEARSLLLVDHTHECIPCRRALKDARTAKVAPVKAAPVTRRYNLQPAYLRWGIAAALVIGFGLIAVPIIQRYLPGSGLDVTVQAADGEVFQISDTRSTAIAAGAKLAGGDRIRTAKNGRALVALGDGSVIEMGERAELSITQNSLGTTIHLSRGAVVVEAAQQKDRQLFVATADSRVAVTGTIFSVNSGTKGARVSVIEGEVRLEHGNAETVLKAGEQAATNRAIQPIPVKDEIAWSRKASSYASTLASLNALNKELSSVPRPGVRHSTQLLDLMPESTTVYAAIPNLTETLTESHRIMQERISQNPALRQWYEREGSQRRGPEMDQVMNTIRNFGQYLGEEIAVSTSMDQRGEPVAPLVLAELKNTDGLRQFLEQQIASYGSQSDRAQIQFVEDPQAPDSTGGQQKRLYVWITPGLFVASPELAQIRQLSVVRQQGGKSSFTASAFHNRIAQIYQNGAGLVVAANLERVLEQTKVERSKGKEGAQHEEALRKLGVLSMKYFVLDQKEVGAKTKTQATISFSEAQRGIPSWLAAPGPMGSLEYISPDANIVAGFVVREPVSLVDDLLGVVETVSPDLRQNLDKLQAERGIDVRRDIADPLGGEFAFAIDGPILPTPSWKMVFEVNKPEHLQQTLEKVVTEVNKEAARFGKSGLVWDRGEIGGRAYYSLRSADFGVEINYTYVNGYMVVGPSRGLVERAVRSQEQNYTLLRSAKFIAGLPADGNANFSAVFYHNLAPLVQPFADRIAQAGRLPSGPQEAIKMAADMTPTLAYAYAQGDSITFAANTDGGPFGLSPATLLGVPSSLDMQNILQRGMKEKVPSK